MEKERPSKHLHFPKSQWILLAGILFLAATIRSPLTSVGPIIGNIRDQLQITNSLAGFLTTIPLLAFAIVSPFTPRLAKRYGLSRTLFYSMIILLLGIIMRSIGNSTLLLIGTFLIGVGIAFANVLLPSLLKLSFPLHIGLMTGLYSVSMSISATLASGIAAPIANQTSYGWQGALGIWGVITFLAIIVWIPQILKKKEIVKTAQKNKKTKPAAPLLRSPLAWSITVFMGLQSFLFYTTASWIPVVLQTGGMTDEAAGWMLALVQLAQLPMMFIIPVIADKVHDQRGLVIGVFACYLIGYGGVQFGSESLTALWMIFIGLGGGSAFGLAMMFFTLRTSTPAQAASISGMAQSIGYLLAAVGPVLFGSLHDYSGSWTLPLYTFLVIAAILFVSGMYAGKRRYISQEADMEAS
ncbi:transporter [Sporosarcina sp. P37]|uniref:CynX/NimT family MFS transporter n=1 Tax=unclassified Sporosarcina TaxID=2647733 RepID=UPI0009BE406F|nr:MULTISPECIES: MFS transporter [unclassified Sporosarcina]ARD49402.1 transporter [Sporosarcina sp. P33]ARK25875.1 transporter [Sporosarcina sp. P37]PID18304.1 MFS transporter [Sporosarcina sp. P35]